METGMIEAIRQMAPSNFRDLIATALRRVELGDTGTIATTSLRDPMSNGRSLEVSWHLMPLECMPQEPRPYMSRVAFLDCSAPLIPGLNFDLPEESENDVTRAGQHVELPQFDEILSCLSSPS